MARSVFVVLAEVQAKLEELAGALAPLRTLMSPLLRDGGAPFPLAKRKRKPGSETAASRKRRVRRPNAKGAQALQGKYMASMRNLSPTDKEAIRAIRAEQGVAAAIAAAAERKPR